ncbi:fibronectin type III domain-containing protein [Nonomuraea endophytica]|uniref:Fibronectin type-III domain-containing protein n=1 Tax=Nonomuraea endophytica TaxID=714136 RepID=A0A7W8EHW3_9ACTN|nr:fibronectin type III domain-containing protein [Nonomuraea endophytica]MBB5081385.1 hypothetical protein [Nonomuraea endophytica]
MLLRLAIYAPNGTRKGVLPTTIGTEVGWPFNDVPALKLTHSQAGPGSDLLSDPCEIAVEVSGDGTSWAEPADSRFLLIRRHLDLTDKAAVEQLDMPGYAWMLRKLILYPGSQPLVDGKRAFLSATPGAILATFLTEGHARGTLTGLTWNFSSTHDSAGQPWAKVLTIYYEPGLDALTTLINLAEQGVLDFSMQGRQLRAYNADTQLARDLATGPAPIDLRHGRDITHAPDVGTLEDAASAVLVVGDNQFQQTYTNPSAVAPWGRWEQYVGQGGVSDPGTAALLADAALKRAERERVQRTRQISLAAARWFPILDYRPGDRVLAPGAGGLPEPLRVRQVTLVRDQTGVLSGNVVLNDRLLEQDIRLARRTAGIVGGSTASGGSGARPAPASPRPRSPTAPAGLIVDAQAYIDSAGVPQGQITATWGAVVTDVNGTAVEIDGYELFMRVNQADAPWFLVALTQADDRNATYSPLVIGEQYAFKVRATNQGARGGFSAQQVVTVPDDIDAPPVPTPPSLSTRLGVIHVGWDGHGVGGVLMPSDFAHLLVWMQDPLSPGWSEVGYLEQAGGIVVPGQPYGQDREFRLTAVDRSGNESAPSSSATIAAVQLVSGDAAASSITTGHLVANAVTAAKIDVGAIQAAHIGANQVTAAKLESVLTLSTRIVAGSAAGARVELNSTGLAAYDSGGVQTVSISSATGSVSLVGQLASGVTGARVVINPSGAMVPELRFYPGAGANYSRIFSDASLFPGEATLISLSGTNSGNTAETRVMHAAGAYHVRVRNPVTTLDNGGFLALEESQSRVGFNRHATTQLQQLTFLPTSTRHTGAWSYSGGDAGLVMSTVTIPANQAGATFTYGPTMASSPYVVATIDVGATGSPRVGACVSARTTTSVFVSPTTTQVVAITAQLWGWRM